MNNPSPFTRPAQHRLQATAACAAEEMHPAKNGVIIALAASLFRRCARAILLGYYISIHWAKELQMFSKRTATNGSRKYTREFFQQLCTDLYQSGFEKLEIFWF